MTNKTTRLVDYTRLLLFYTYNTCPIGSVIGVGCPLAIALAGVTGCF